MDAGAGEGDAGGAAHGVELLPFRAGRIEPAEGRDDVLARLENARDDRGVGHEWAVHDAVGVDGENGVDVAGRGDAERVASDERANVDAVLVGTVNLTTGQLQVGMAEHAFDGSTADATGR